LKVFPKIHRLNDPPRSRTPQDDSYRTSRTELHSRRPLDNSIVYDQNKPERNSVQQNPAEFFSKKIIQRSSSHLKREEENYSPKSFRFLFVLEDARLIKKRIKEIIIIQIDHH